MPRHLNFRYNGNITALCVFHDLSRLLLSIIAAVPLLPFPAPCAFSDEFRITFDFEPPSLVIGEVPVENIQLMVSQKIDVAFDIFQA